MYDEQVRPMNERERVAIQRIIDAPLHGYATFKSTAMWVALWSAGLTIGILGLGFGTQFNIVVSILMSIVFGPVVLTSAYGILAAVNIYREDRGMRREVETVTRDIWKRTRDLGMVRARRVLAHRVAVVEPIDDEGACCIFDLADGRVLVLRGQEYELDECDECWPNAEFEIVSTLEGDLPIGVFCLGEALAPIRTMETDDCRSEFDVELAQEEVLAVNFDAFLDWLTDVQRA
ncbi:hypothetical protein [Pyruvatibacter sp.]|uniref:hypothetical protein n=1 Tax=Pyruvatibacter sp. TaxID=1981328 RepID=UPI0032EFA924